MYMYKYVKIYVYIHTYISTYRYTCACIHTYLPTYMYACMHRHTYMFMCGHMHKQLYRYIDSYVYAYLHAYMHTKIHTGTRYIQYIHRHIHDDVRIYTHKCSGRSLSRPLQPFESSNPRRDVPRQPHLRSLALNHGIWRWHSRFLASLAPSQPERAGL